jgi:hypothetical protein
VFKEAVERDARLDNETRCTALLQAAGQGSQALLHRPWLDGESPFLLVDAYLTADGHAVVIGEVPISFFSSTEG